jgi:hypothetical protein
MDCEFTFSGGFMRCKHCRAAITVNPADDWGTDPARYHAKCGATRADEISTTVAVPGCIGCISPFDKSPAEVAAKVKQVFTNFEWLPPQLAAANRAAVESQKQLAALFAPAQEGSAAAAAGQPPSALKMAANYGTALARWTLAGRPTRSQSRINELLAICHACEFFDRPRGRCLKCGCPVNDRPEAGRNKLAMATESCPDEPPRWTADV